MRKSTSSIVLKAENEKRNEGYCSASFGIKADNTCETCTLPLWQALPFDQAIHFISN